MPLASHMGMNSEMLCARCGLVLTYCFHGWKHVANGHTGKACPKPVPVNRVAYEQEAADLVRSLRLGRVDSRHEAG